VRFDGTVSIKAPRQKVWDFLTDPEKVAGAAPGLEKLEIVEPGKKFRATTSVGFGAVKVRFVNDVEWVEMTPPSNARMKAHGTAPGSGNAAKRSRRRCARSAASRFSSSLPSLCSESSSERSTLRMCSACSAASCSSSRII